MENPNETNRDESRLNEENASQRNNPTGQHSTPKPHSENPVTPPDQGTQNPLTSESHPRSTSESGQFGEKQESQEFRNQPGVSSQHQASNQPSGEAGNSDVQSGFSAGRANVSGSNVSGSAQHERLSGSSKENEGRQKQEGDDIDPALQGGKSA